MKCPLNIHSHVPSFYLFPDMSRILSAFDTNLTPGNLGFWYNINNHTVKGICKKNDDKDRHTIKKTTTGSSVISTRSEARHLFSISAEAAIKICLGVAKVGSTADLYKEFSNNHTQNLNCFTIKHIEVGTMQQRTDNRNRSLSLVSYS